MLIEAYTSPDGSFRWLDVVDPTGAELEEIAQTFQLHSATVRDCLDAKHLPKYEPLEENDFMILRAYDEKSGRNATSVRELTQKISIFFSKSYIITIHRREQPFLVQTRDVWIKKMEAKQETVELSRLLGRLIFGILSSYGQGLYLCQMKIEAFESLIYNARSTSTSIRQKFMIKRKVYVFKRMLKMSLNVLSKLKEVWEEDPLRYQDIKECGESQYFEAEQIVEDINNLMNLNLSLASHYTSEIIRVLTIFSVFFSPLTFIVGVYGMNFDYMPELKLKYGYPAVMVFMALICFMLFLWFRKKGWLR